jgi:hypothetical protein
VNPDIEGVGLIRVTSLDGIAEGQAEASIHDLRRPKPLRTRPTTGRLRESSLEPGTRRTERHAEPRTPGTVERPAVEATCHQLEARRLRGRPGRGRTRYDSNRLLAVRDWQDEDRRPER